MRRGDLTVRSGDDIQRRVSPRGLNIAAMA